MTTLTTPIEIDTRLAEVWRQMDATQRDIERQERYLSDEYLKFSFDETKYARLLEEHDTLAAEANELLKLYTDWTRYWHVQNNNGHIHTSQFCTSCFPTTVYFWRTDLSGLTPEEVVEREAYNACSVCMPIAPAEQRAARQRYNAEQRAARKAERDAKATEKLRKAAERAQKLMAKVNAFYEANGGQSAVMAWDSHKLYDEHLNLPSTVGNVVYDDYHVLHGQSRFNRDPRAIIAEAQAKGLLS